MFKFEKAIKAAVAFFVLLFCFYIPVGAETDFDSNKKLAEQGDALAQFNIGIMYGLGQGIPQNYAEAFKWFKKAAEQGDATAQYNLGIMYEFSRGVPQNYFEALKW